MIKGKNESKTLPKHISCDCNQWWNSNKYRCECKKLHACEKNYVLNAATCISKIFNTYYGLFSNFLR